MKKKKIVPMLMLALAAFSVFSVPAHACGGGSNAGGDKTAETGK